MRTHRKLFLIAVVCLALSAAAGADVFNMPGSLTSLEFVTVGNPGNAPHHVWGGGAVDHEYCIGKYEVTNAQYGEFLDAVAAVGDPHELYSTWMADPSSTGGIERVGAGTPSDPWIYGPKGGDPNWLNRPVTFVSFWDACRFANWLHNGQPIGAQDATTTEDGAYTLTEGENPDITRNTHAKAWIPSMDEWRKAAYYKGGGDDAGYWAYPTQSDSPPTAELPPGTDEANGSANYNLGSFYDPIYVDPAYGTTEVGAYDFKPSASPYGTFDQGGNVWEWTEDTFGSARQCRGGSFHWNYLNLFYSAGTQNSPSNEVSGLGFRVAEVPEPATLSLLALGGLALLRQRRR